MQDLYAINKRSDFDLYFEDLGPAWLPRAVRMGIGTCRALIFALRRGRVMHMPLDGFALNASIFWRWESHLFRFAGIKTILLPYGADGYVYSRLIDPSMRYGLLASYPALARKERAIGARVDHWTRRADVLIAGILIDGVGRWDITLAPIFSINVDEWTAKTHYSDHDGRNGSVRILHTPNHRGFKGTEFLLDAVDRLKAEGLLIDLVLLEKVPNDVVRQTMLEVDIHAEQFIGIGYALSGIEGMAAGLPVLANLDNETFTRVFRRYSFLDECPILSSPPERLVSNLRLLIRNPRLREELGRAGRLYVEKYHSYETARYMFGAAYEHILDGKERDLINLFHPLKSDYSKASPRVQHPLVENLLPAADPRHQL
jgi:glycosyltransferase involved in cell wall biosynthesis